MTSTELGKKIDALAASFDAGFDRVDTRLKDLAAAQEREFAAIATTFDELRANASLSICGLEGRMNARFDKVDGRLDRVDQRLNGMDQRFDGMDRRFDRVEGKLDRVLATRPSRTRGRRRG
jgi:archaellum component FlaC